MLDDLMWCNALLFLGLVRRPRVV